jgi:hypothetical protein
MSDQSEHKKEPDGLVFRLVAALTAVIVTVPALAWFAYLEVPPVIVVSLTVVSMPLAMLAAQRYLLWLLWLYRSKYRTFSIAPLGRSIATELNMRLLLLDLVPVGQLIKELGRMEEAKLVRRKTDWRLMLRDVTLCIAGGLGIYFAVWSLHLGLRVVPIYLAFLGFISCSRLVTPSRQAYAWVRIMRGFRTETLKAGLFDSLYKGFIPRLPPSSPSDPRI